MLHLRRDSIAVLAACSSSLSVNDIEVSLSSVGPTFVRVSGWVTNFETLSNFIYAVFHSRVTRFTHCPGPVRGQSKICRDTEMFSCVRLSCHLELAFALEIKLKEQKIFHEKMSLDFVKSIPHKKHT